MTEDSSVLAALEAEFDDSEVPPVLVDQDQMARRLAFDVVPHEMVLHILQILGMTGVSDDVVNTEHSASHVRGAISSQLSPIIWEMSAQVAQLQEATINATGEAVSPPAEALAPLLFTAIKAVLDEFLDLGVIHFSHGQVVVIAEEEEGQDE